MPYERVSILAILIRNEVVEDKIEAVNLINEHEVEFSGERIFEDALERELPNDKFPRTLSIDGKQIVVA